MQWRNVALDLITLACYIFLIPSLIAFLPVLSIDYLSPLTLLPRQVLAKRKYGRQKPERDSYASDEEYEAAFNKWRERRDKNNRAVRRSRQTSSKA